MGCSYWGLQAMYIGKVFVVFGILDSRGMSVLFASVPEIMYVNEGLQVP